MKNILLTGGSGNLANYVAPYLQDQGYNVTLTDRVPPKPDSENHYLCASKFLGGSGFVSFLLDGTDFRKKLRCV